MKIYKIRKKEDFAYIFKHGSFLNSDPFFIKYLIRIDNSQFHNPRYGVVASKKVGNAVKRNLAKRRIRAMEKIIFSHGLKNLDYIFLLKKKILIENFYTLTCKLKKALNEIRKTVSWMNKKTYFWL